MLKLTFFLLMISHKGFSYSCDIQVDADNLSSYAPEYEKVMFYAKTRAAIDDVNDVNDVNERIAKAIGAEKRNECNDGRFTEEKMGLISEQIVCRISYEKCRELKEQQISAAQWAQGLAEYVLFAEEAKVAKGKELGEAGIVAVGMDAAQQEVSAALASTVAVVKNGLMFTTLRMAEFANEQVTGAMDERTRKIVMRRAREIQWYQKIGPLPDRQDFKTIFANEERRYRQQIANGVLHKALRSGAALATPLMGVGGIPSFLAIVVATSAYGFAEAAYGASGTQYLGPCRDYKSNEGDDIGDISKSGYYDMVQEYYRDGKPTEKECYPNPAVSGGTIDFLQLSRYYAEDSNGEKVNAQVDVFRQQPHGDCLCKQMHALYDTFKANEEMKLTVRCEADRMQINVPKGSNLHDTVGDTLTILGDFTKYSSDGSFPKMDKIGLFSPNPYGAIARQTGPGASTRRRQDVRPLFVSTHSSQRAEYAFSPSQNLISLRRSCLKKIATGEDYGDCFKKKFDKNLFLTDWDGSIKIPKSSDSYRRGDLAEKDATDPDEMSLRERSAMTVMALTRTLNSRFYETSRCCGESNSGEYSSVFNFICNKYGLTAPAGQGGIPANKSPLISR